MSLAGKTALVTGSTSGIGEGVARSLAEAGANIVLNGFGDASEIETLRAGLEAEHGVQASYSGADLTLLDELNDMIAEAEARFGTVDILVNNAGVQHVAPLEEFPPDKWAFIIQLNLSAAFHTSRAVFAGMKARGYGRIINIASAHALVASPFKAAYVAAKHGVLGLTKTIAIEGAAHGVTANAICPGYVLTPLVEKQIPDTAKARGLTEEQVKHDVLLAAQPTKEFVTTGQIGALAAFLASEHGAQINGAALPVDGGWTAQ
ncbi:3-hydroxybutyrate dehydrogenase [Maricaulaceae bacterium MS644]